VHNGDRFRKLTGRCDLNVCCAYICRWDIDAQTLTVCHEIPLDPAAGIKFIWTMNLVDTMMVTVLALHSTVYLRCLSPLAPASQRHSKVCNADETMLIDIECWSVAVVTDKNL
jgi:hypothetical protein